MRISQVAFACSRTKRTSRARDPSGYDILLSDTKDKTKRRPNTSPERHPWQS